MANEMRRWGPWVVVVVVGVGCSRPNPAYDGGGGQTDGTVTMGSTVTEPGEDVGETLDGSDGPEGPCVAHADCADDVFCNGVETCDPGRLGADERGCVEGTDPCAEGANCEEGQKACVTDCARGTDADLDGEPAVECGGQDCNDSNDQVFPSATEVCDMNGLDEDCDPSTHAFMDADDDGANASTCCNLGDGGALECGTDCDDTLRGIIGPGDWAHCSACGEPCGILQACVEGACAPARRVFVTSMVSTGNLGGAVGAHEMCQAAANAEGIQLGGTFMAFLNGGGANVEDLEHADVPYVMLDGTEIAGNWQDLTDGDIDTAFDQNELREVVTVDYAWTGIGGAAMLDAHCGGWLLDGGGCGKAGPCGYVGEIEHSDARWDGDGSRLSCDTLLPLYCIEQAT